MVGLMIGRSKETKIRKGISLKNEHTEFTMHVSQRVLYRSNSLFDFNEFKLRTYAENHKDPSISAEIFKLIELYKSGLVAIAWRDGEPIYVKITRD